jgi:phosphoserine phosphatase
LEQLSVKDIGRDPVDPSWRMGSFDLDGTLITGTTILRHVGRQLNRLDEVTQLIDGYENYSLSNYDVSTAAARMFTGLTHTQLFGLMAGIPRLADIQEAVRTLKSLGVRVVVATVSFDFAAAWFTQTYQFDNNSGITLEFDKNGRATGRVRRHVSEEDKATFLIREAQKHDFSTHQVFHVGDSRSDIRAFRAVGFSVALNATPEAKAAASAQVDTQSLMRALSLIPGLLPDSG